MKTTHYGRKRVISLFLFSRGITAIIQKLREKWYSQKHGRVKFITIDSLDHESN